MDLLTSKQIAKRLGLHPTTVAYRARKGTFPPPDIPGRESKEPNRWHQDTVDKWVEWRAELIGFDQIAEWLGKSPHTIRLWSYQRPLPEPDLMENNKKLWEWLKVQEWADHFVEWEDN